MPANTIGEHNLISRLDRFLSKSHQIFSQGSEVSDRDKKALEKEYKTLYGAWEKLPDNWINKNVGPEKIRAVNFLALGLTHSDDLFGRATRLFTADAQKTAWAVAEFVKTREAFDLVKKDIPDEQLNELAKSFGSLLGVEVTASFVRSVRTERMGSILGYALSGLVTEHMRQWDNNENGIRSNFGGVGGREKFLAEMIRANDKEAVYSMDEAITDDGHCRSAFRINIESRSSVKARGPFRPDHCFITPPVLDAKGKVVAAGKLTIGTSTAFDSAEDRSYSFAKCLACARAMTEAPSIQGEPNPYYGFEVQSFSCMLGNLPTTKLDGTLEDGSAIAKMVTQKRHASAPGITQAQVVMLAQSQFLSLFATPDPSPRVIEQLRGINPHIPGCDTLELYEIFQKEADVRADSRVLARWVLTQGIKLSGFLAQDNVEVNFDDKGQNVLVPILNTLLGISKNYFNLFPLGGSQRLTAEEQKLFSRFGESMEELAKKLYEKSLGGVNKQLLDDLDIQAEYLQSPASVRRRAEKHSQQILASVAPAIHDDQLYESISIMADFNNSSTQRMTSDGLFKNLFTNENQTRLLFHQAFKHAIGLSLSEGGADENNDDPGWNEEFLRQYASAIDHIVSNKKPDQWKPNETWVGMENRQALLAASNQFLKDNDKHPAAALVKASRKLLGRSGGSNDEGGARILNTLSNRLSEPSLPNTIHDSVKAIIKLARNGEPDGLVSSLRIFRDMGKPAVEKKARKAPGA